MKSISFNFFQVVKPVNLEALSKWVGSIPDDVVEDMGVIAPMLEKMGYDPNGNPPNYGTPDTEVVKNTKEVKEHEDIWNKQGMNWASVLREVFFSKSNLGTSLIFFFVLGEIVKQLSKKDIGPTGK